MLSLGMDIGTSTVKLVLLKNQEIEKQWMAVHHGNPFVCLKKGLSTLELAMDTPFSLCVTGSNTEALLEQDSAIPSLGDIPAIVEGVRWIIPQVGSVIEIGSQGARFTECSAPFRSVCGLCQNRYHPPPAGRRFHAGYPARIVLCHDP